MMVGEEYWITADGRKIAVGEMSEAHLRNVLRMLIRKKRTASSQTFREAILAEIRKDREEVDEPIKEDQWDYQEVSYYPDYMRSVGK